MARALCARCSQSFEADQPWKRICLPCWQQSKARETQKEIEAAYERGYREGLSIGKQCATTQPPGALELRKNLRALRQLCHPDKHQGSACSTRISQWLNSMEAQ